MSNQPAQASYSAFVRKLFNRSGDPSKDFAHAILGVVTECHEYEFATDDVNAIEELGDTEFYVVAAQQVIEDYLGAPLPMADIEAEVDKEMRIYLVSERKYDLLQDTLVELLDHAKRWVGYEREPASLQAVFGLVLYAQQAARELGRVPHSDAAATQSHIRSVNMAKLLKRYPGGDFDQFRALQRDLGAERATLETAVLG
jgi:hypothetical protein